MSTWQAAWFNDRDPNTVADQIAKFLNTDLKAVHPIYVKVGVGRGDLSPTTAVVIYKNETKPPTYLSIYGAPRWTEFVGSVDEVLRHLNNFNDHTAILSQFAFAKHGNPGTYTVFLFSPQGAE